MIPLLVTVRFRRSDGRWRQLHIPVLPVLLVLSPPLLLAGLVACVVYRISLVGALCGAGQLLCALPGTRFEIEDGQSVVLVSIR
jgi:hypothetical protein